MIILKDIEKQFDKIQYPLITSENPQTLRKLEVEWENLNLIKNIKGN